MRKAEVVYSSLCFLLALVAAGLFAAELVFWGFVVAWGGSAAVAFAYVVTRRRRRSTGS